MSELDYALDYLEDNNTIESGVSVSAARIELSHLRAELKQANAACADMNVKYSAAMTELSKYRPVTA